MSATKHLQLRDLDYNRYKNQFSTATPTSLNDPKYCYFITSITAGGAWSLEVKGFHPDGSFTIYTRSGTGNLQLQLGTEIAAQEILSAIGITQVSGFTIKAA